MTDSTPPQDGAVTGPQIWASAIREAGWWRFPEPAIQELGKAVIERINHLREAQSRELAEARAEIERLTAERDRCRDAKAAEVLRNDELIAELARLRAPSGKDAMEVARLAIAKVLSPQRWSNLNAGEESGFLAEAEQLLARAIESQRGRGGKPR